MAEKRDGGVEGILRGLGDLMEKLGELAEKGQELKRSSEFNVDTGGGKDLKGVYGFSVKVGLGGDGAPSGTPKVEPFGNIRRDEETGASVVQEITEPMVDVFEEDDHIKIVAEIPGVGDKDVKLDLNGDILSIDAARGDKKYRKEVLLPRGSEEIIEHSCNNGILDVKLR